MEYKRGDQILPSVFSGSLMKCFPGFLSLLLVCCSSVSGGYVGVGAGGSRSDSSRVTDILRPEDHARIGQRIWKNECGGTLAGLTSWNSGEGFASLGIGHFIWYPRGMSGPFEESFPSLLRFLASRGIRVPGWLAASTACPWRTKNEFQVASQSSRMVELRRFLSETIAGQTAYTVARMEAALPKLLAAVAVQDRALVERRFRAVASSPEGVYALVDYVNFKGEGINPSERYRGEGWGMLQVLQGMQPARPGTASAVEFGRSASRVLARRVKNAPRDESRWLAGWKNRCQSYGRPF